ncbi:MAG TPA: DUF3160 domain-containing protein [Candidatus Woesebacteria bacterium]|nr:DUF3160 domain-containing protein [Bacteroidia bacterium]HNS65620.1 DUF3160 domain-containing protein [Candidatus Woesebacteria bacterium]
MNQSETSVVSSVEITIPSSLPPNQPNQKNNLSKMLFALGFCCVIFAVGGLGLMRILNSKPLIQNKAQELNHNQENASITLISDQSFAEYKQETTQFLPVVPDYSAKVSDLTNFSNFETSLKKPFSEVQRQALDQSQFFITPNLDTFYADDPNDPTSRADDWSKLYQTIGGGSIVNRKPENAVFVSTDYLLHVYHRLLEKEFEYIEQTKFYPKLSDMTTALFDQAVLLEKQTQDEADKQSYQRLIAFLGVPKVLLDVVATESSSGSTVDTSADSQELILASARQLKDRVPAQTFEQIETELTRIMSHEQMEVSSIFGELLAEEDLATKEDYTQYSPRSHYNKNSVLRSYFRAMMWYGRTNFVISSTELTRDAMNLTNLVQQTNQMDNWLAIFMPTAFFVGKSDDLGLSEYREAMVRGANDLVNSNSIQAVQAFLAKYEGPKIMSSAMFGDQVFELTKEELQQKTKGFRLMGQRFTPDAFIFSSLTQGDEKPDPATGEKLPSQTTALMVMSALGNQTADPLVNQWIQANAPNSTKVIPAKLNQLKQQFASLQTKDWTQNIYWSWLYTIKSLFPSSGDLNGYPSFMKQEAWKTKSLLTSLGSWTELKHDTLLYAKQSYAEMGAGGLDDIPPVPKGYVEPNIEFFDRLIALVKMTKTGLENYEVLPIEFVGRNESFIEALEFFRDIAVKQLQNQVITEDEFEQLRIAPGNLDYIMSPLPNEEQIENNARSALIADVHTDVPGGSILYEATGIPHYVYVAVQDANGSRLTKGLVFNYYEFTNPIGDRLNDEKWRAKNYSQDKSQLPASPAWVAPIVK